MRGSVEVHVERVVLHGRADAAAVERSIVEQVSAALEEHGLDRALVASGGAERVDAVGGGTSAASVGRGVARTLAEGAGR